MHLDPEWLFESTDYEGTPVRLSRTTWQAKAESEAVGAHPEIRDYLADIQATIASPDLVFQSTRDARACLFYRLHVGRGDFVGKHLVVVVKYVQQAAGPTRLRKYGLSEPCSLYPRSPLMAENATSSPLMLVQYDEQADILTFAFTASPQPAVAEEVADEVWVRYDPQTRRVFTVDVLNFSTRAHAAFGPALTYTERTDPERLQALPGLPVPRSEQNPS